MGLGPNVITVQNNADFSGGTIGNWIKTSLGIGTLAYNIDNIGGDDNQQALLTAGTGDTYIYADLDSTNFSIPQYGLIRFEVDLYAPATNVNSNAALIVGAFGVTPDTVSQVITKDQWITLTLDTLFATDTVGTLRLGLISNPTVGDKLYFDNVKIRQVTSSGLTSHGLGLGL